MMQGFDDKNAYLSQLASISNLVWSLLLPPNCCLVTTENEFDGFSLLQ